MKKRNQEDTGRPSGQPAPMQQSTVGFDKWLSALTYDNGIDPATEQPRPRGRDPEGKAQQVDVTFVAPTRGNAAVQIVAAASKAEPLVYAGRKPVSTESQGGLFEWEDGRERYFAFIEPGCILAEFESSKQAKARRIWVCVSKLPDHEQIQAGQWIAEFTKLG